MGKRYQNLDDENDDEDYMYQSRSKPLHSKRYPPSRPSLCDQQRYQQGKPFMLYANDDVNCKPSRLFYSYKKMSTPEKLYDEILRLQEKANDSARSLRINVVQRVFKWPSGQEVENVYELDEKDGVDTLVYSDGKPLKRVTVDQAMMNNSRGFSNHAKLGRISHNSRGSQKASPTLKSNGSMNSINTAVNIKVRPYNNTSQKCSVFINPKQDFLQLMETITEMLEMDPACEALYTTWFPKTKIDSMSGLKKLGPRNNDEFIAVSKDAPPPDIQSPGRNGRSKNGTTNGHIRQSNNNFRDAKGRNYQRHNGNRKSQNEDEDQSPTRGSPKRDTYREKYNGNQGYEKPSPRRHEEQNGHAYAQDNDQGDEHYGSYGNGRADDERSDSSRGNSPDDEELEKRRHEMEDKKIDLDKDIEC